MAKKCSGCGNPKEMHADKTRFAHELDAPDSSVGVLEKNDNDSSEYGSMSRNELLDLTDERGIEVPARATKTELIEALEDADADEG